MSSVNKIVFLIITSALFFVFPAMAAEEVNGKTFYTIANIWYERPDQIESSNYHKGTILPVGTKVKITEVRDGTWPVTGGSLNSDRWKLSIRFTDESGQSYEILYISRHAKEGTSIWDFFRQYFSENNPLAEGGAFTSLTGEEQKRVKEGVIATGMSKKAVVMAYGYPPGHRTPSLEQDKWIYWISRFKTRAVYFSDNMVMPEPRGARRPSSIDQCIRACKENTSRTSEQCFDDCKRE